MPCGGSVRLFYKYTIKTKKEGEGMKIILALAVAAGLTAAAACMQKPDTEGDKVGMNISALSNYDFYGEMVKTDADKRKSVRYSGEITDEECKKKIVYYLEQAEKNHKIDIDENSVIIDGEDNMKLTAKNKKTNDEYTISLAYLSEEGVKVPVVLVKNGENIACYADVHDYSEGTESIFGPDNLSGQLRYYAKDDIINENNISEEKDITPKMGKTNIVLVKHYTNGAWMREDRGFFADMNGNVYGFDFSSEDYLNEPYDDLMSELEKIYNDPSSKPSDIYGDTAFLEILAEYADKISPDAKINYSQMACDAGQNTTYLVTGDKRFAFVYSSGDSEEISEDKYAEMARTVIERNIFY